jgi:Uma2 family endonuclease
MKRPATYEDLLAVPEHLVAEIVDGELVTSPRPGGRHANAASWLGAVLVGPYRQGIGGPGGWIILDEPELHLGGHVLVPDLAGWRRERMPAPPEEPFFTVPPDWVCEVLSPRTGVLDRKRKLPIYASEEVGYVWLIEPVLRTLEVYRRSGLQWSLLGTFAEEDRVRAEPFDAVELELGRLWVW